MHFNQQEQSMDKLEKIHGLIKLRYSYFHVHELDHLGNMVTLSSFELPNNKLHESMRMSADLEVEEMLSPLIINQIKELQNSDECLSNPSVEIKVGSADKTSRARIHHFLSQFDRLCSETIERDGEKFIRVFMPSDSKERKMLRRRPFDRAKFTHCVLYKEGLDTSEAINFLSRKLKLNPKHITFAGTKDKQAKTVQRICFSNIEAQRLLSLNACSPHSKLGNFSYHSTSLHLGDLSGNHFKILVQDIKFYSMDQISRLVDGFSLHGFINFYGPQRFGTFKVPTYVIGKYLLQMDWLKVFDLILEPNDDNDPVFMKEVKKIWLEKRDAAEAWKKIPHYHKSIESSLIHGLSKFYQSGDHWASFKSIPRNMRTLYMHSYQSFLWNYLASYRFKQFGLKSVVGDMVILNPEEDRSLEPDLKPEDEEITHKSNPRSIPKVKLLTETDVSNYTIFDIVIPLEGSYVTIPDDSNLKEYSIELLKEHGVKDGLKDFCPQSELPIGAYRKMMVLPKNVKHEVIPYGDEDNLDTFIPSDYDLMLAKQKEQESTIAENQVKDNSNPEPSVASKEKDKTCLIIEFSLPPSSYATVALREILEDPDEGLETRKRNSKRGTESTSASAEDDHKKFRLDETLP